MIPCGRERDVGKFPRSSTTALREATLRVQEDLFIQAYDNQHGAFSHKALVFSGRSAAEKQANQGHRPNGVRIGNPIQREFHTRIEGNTCFGDHLLAKVLRHWIRSNRGKGVSILIGKGKKVADNNAPGTYHRRFGVLKSSGEGSRTVT